MKEEKYLPIGTVCRLKDGIKNVMITGFCPMTEEDETTIYDYSACLYPEGLFSSDANFLFNHDQIVEILFKGFENEEEKEFKKNLKEVLAQNNININSSEAKEQTTPNSVEDFDIPIMNQQNVTSNIETFDATDVANN